MEVILEWTIAIYPHTHVLFFLLGSLMVLSTRCTPSSFNHYLLSLPAFFAYVDCSHWNRSLVSQWSFLLRHDIHACIWLLKFFDFSKYIIELSLDMSFSWSVPEAEE